MKRSLFCLCMSILILLLAQACNSATIHPVLPTQTTDRLSKIPTNAVKMLPQADEHPPHSLSSEYAEPVPLPGIVNSAGAEDSPFLSEDGNTLYFFFTPDVSVPAEKQILDGVTGIYATHKVNREWSQPKRILLQDPKKLALDGCEFIQGKVMWFCSAREGSSGIHWYSAELIDGAWQKWKNADFNPNFQVGELHISSDGSELYFGSERPGGKGGLDIWVSHRDRGEWQAPVNVAMVNTTDNEGWPWLSPDGKQLWFNRNYGIWRSLKINNAWQKPELIISPLAGEPTLDPAGNLVFVHHFYQGDRMIEADLYIAYQK